MTAAAGKRIHWIGVAGWFSIGLPCLPLLNKSDAYLTIRGFPFEPAGITLAEFLRAAALELEDLYKTAGWTWSRLRRDAGLQNSGGRADEAQIARAVPRLLHLDDPDRLALYRRAVEGELPTEALDASSVSGRALMGLHFAIWGPNSTLSSLRESVDRLRQHPALAAELGELFDVLEDRASMSPSR